MAHRRALVRRREWVPWLLVPLALTLDGVTALSLAGYRWPLGLAVPEALLIAAAVLVYGALAFVAFRTRPISVRLVAAGVLLGLHAGLVAAHTLVFASLWSLPVPAAVRLAHRWSPLIPLLQLVWVPLLALPFARLTQAPAPSPSASRRSGSAPARRDVLASRGTQSGQRGRPEPDRDLTGEPSAHAIASVATVETMCAALPEPVAVAAPATPPTVVSTVSVVEAPSAALLFPAVAEPEPPATGPTPMVVVDDLDLDEPVLTSADAAPTPAEPAAAEPVAAGGQAEVEPIEAPAAEPVPSVDHAVLLVEQEPPSVSLPAVPETVASIDAVVVLTGDTPEPDDLHAAEGRHIPETAPVTALALLPAPPPFPSPAPPVVAAEPPLDLYIVARLFEPYGSLLSRDGAVLVDWAPRPDAAIVCVSPREVPRERMVNLAGRLARALAVAGSSSPPTPVRRLSLRSPDGVAVLTPLDRGILVAAARRPGAAALLEVLSARVAPGPLGVEASGTGSDDARVAQDLRVSDAVRVETPAATLDVLAPSAVDAESLGELAGRLLQAIAEDSNDRTPHTLSVDLGSHCLMVHPVHPGVRPPRFVAVVGGRESPGLLWRRTERAARALREAS